MSKSVGNVVDPIALVDAVRRSTRCASSCCARCRSVRTAATATRRSSAGSTPTWPTSSATWRSARCRWSPRTSTAWSRSPASSRDDDRRCWPPPTRCWPRVRGHFDVPAMHLALEAIWSVLGAANRYFSAQEPWVLRKTDPSSRFATVLYTTLEVVRIAALLMPAGDARRRRASCSTCSGQPADAARLHRRSGPGWRRHRRCLPRSACSRATRRSDLRHNRRRRVTLRRSAVS